VVSLSEIRIYHIAILFLIFASILLFLNYSTAPGVYGTTTLSVDRVEYDDGTKTFRIFLAVNGGPDVIHASGFIPRDKLATDNAVSEEDVYIDIKAYPFYCTYVVDTKAEVPIYKLDYETYDYPGLINWFACNERYDYFANLARDPNSNVIGVWQYPFGATCYVVVFKKTLVGYYSNHIIPSEQYSKIEIDIRTSSGKHWKANVTSGSEAYVNGIHISRIGDLPSNYKCEDTSSGAYFDANEQRWYAVDPSVYSQYFNLAPVPNQGLLYDCINEIPSKHPRECRDEWNQVVSYFKTMLRPLKFIAGTQTYQTSYTSGTANYGKFVLEAPSTLKVPLVLIEIPADKITLRELYGKPQIVGFEPEKIKLSSTETQYFRVKVKNVGDGRGTFRMELSCNNPFSVAYDGDQITLYKGETGYLRGAITGACEQDVSGYCNVKVYQVGKAGIYEDSAKLTIECTPKCVCFDAGQKTCGLDGKTILECDGCKWVKVDECGNGTFCNNAKCINVGCLVDADCDDGNPNTIDKCVKPFIGSPYCEHKAVKLEVEKPTETRLPSCANCFALFYNSLAGGQVCEARTFDIGLFGFNIARIPYQQVICPFLLLTVVVSGILLVYIITRR